MKRKLKATWSAILILCVMIQLVPAMPVVAENESNYPKSIWDHFKNPPPNSKTRPLWFWNEEVVNMDDTELEEIVERSFYESGYYGFGILPDWIQDYMGETYLHKYGVVLNKAKELGMKMCLYDENGFPSFNAGGLLAEEWPDYTTKRLDKIEASAAASTNVQFEVPPGWLMGAVAMNTDTKERIDITDSVIMAEPDLDSPGVYASSIFSGSYDEFKAFDGDLKTRWNSSAMSGGNQWLEVRYPKAQTFDSVTVHEALGRTTKYSIQYWDDAASEWVIAAQGATFGDGTPADATRQISFDAVTSRKVRLYIHKITQDSVSIYELEIYNGQTKLAVPEKDLTSNATGISASSYFTLLPGYTADKAFDGDYNTRWNARTDSFGNQWLQITYEKPTTFDSVKIYESMGRITSYTVQYWENGVWKNAAAGTTIGSGTGVDATKQILFDPVTSTRVRFYINSITRDSASIYEMEVYNGTAKLAIPPNKLASTVSHIDYTTPSAGNWKVMVFMCVKDGASGMDYLDRESVGKFIEVTHEVYYKAFPEHFGPNGTGTFDVAFYDEPTYGTPGGGADGARMWTPKYNEKFEAQNGYSPVLLYPSLWEDIGADTASARHALNQFRSDLYATEYIKTMRDWCNAHGLELTGHMIYEEIPNPVGIHGDLMKVFKHQDRPGVDLIGYYGYTQEAYKIVSSSAYNWDHGKVMVEAYGAIWNMPTNVLYKSAMDLFAKGVNVLIPHAIWYNTSPDKIKFPPELSYRDPVYGPVLPAYNEYMGRLQQLLQDGRHVADIGMLYPIETLESVYHFTNNRDFCNPADADYMGVGETMSLKARRDFTYIHPEILDEKVTVEGDLLKLNNEINFEQYKVFLIPGMHVISLKSLEKIKEFYDNGGKVIATTQLPYRSAEQGKDSEVASLIREMFGVEPSTGLPITGDGSPYTKKTNINGGASYFIKNGYDTKLLGILDDALTVYDVEFEDVRAISGGNLSYIHKVKEGSDLYFMANSSDTPVDTWVRIKGAISPSVWNPHTGTKFIPEHEYITEDGQSVTRVKMSLDPVTSLFIMDENVTSQTVTITVHTDKNEIYIGEIADATGLNTTAKLKIEAMLDSGDIVTLNPSAITYKSSDPSIAAVDENGVVKGCAPGDVTITATLIRDGSPVESSAPVTVSAVTLDKVILTANQKYIRQGETTRLETRIKFSNGKIFTVDDASRITYTTDRPDLIDISDIGVVSGPDERDTVSFATITATLSANGTFYASNGLKVHTVPQKNVALASNGGKAAASSTINANYPAVSVINGDRTGTGWGSGGGWNDGTNNQYPDYMEIAFDGSKTINQVDIITLQDYYENPAQPTKEMTFSTYGITEFVTEYWTGSEWAVIPDTFVTGNNKVWNQFTFDPVTTTKIRVKITNANSYSRLVEVEAWEFYDMPVVDASVADPDTGNPIAGVKTNEDFAATITTPDTVTNVKLVNENGMSIGKKSVTSINNDDGTITWTMVSSVATAGENRTLAVHTAVDGIYTDSGVSILLNIAGVDPAIISVVADQSAVKNQAFTVTVVTSKTIDKIKLTNENGATIGLLSQAFVISGNTKTWTLTAKIGTAGDNRTIHVLGAVKNGAYADYDIAFTIAVTNEVLHRDNEV